MIYIHTDHLKPNMILARDIIVDATFLPYISCGQTLTAPAIERLKQLNIPGAYINSRICNDIVVDDLIDVEVKRNIVDNLKTVFKKTSTEKSLSISSASLSHKTAEYLIDTILSKEEHIFNIVDMKKYSDYSYTHGMYVAVLSSLMGMAMGFDKNSLIELTTAGLLHDIGTIGIPPHILDKNSPLTEDDWEIVRTHPLLSVKRLRPCCNISSQAISGVVSHHERYDGTGYPNKLAGESIPLFGRILALADVYDALTSDRPFRKALPSNEAIEYIMSCSGSQFDYELVKVFMRCVTAYHVGSLLQLSNGYLGVVVNNSPMFPLRPTVRLILPEGMEGQEINLATDFSYNNVTVIKMEEDVDLAHFAGH